MTSNNPEKQDVLLNAPVYRRIEEDLRNRIRNGQWSVGMQLPSRKELAREYEVDLTTLQRAISALLGDGTLRAEVPRGTFVARANQAPQTETNRAVVEDVTRPSDPHAPLHRNTRLVATLGILAFLENNNWNWDSMIADVVERNFAEAGGTTRSVNLHHLSHPGSLGKATLDLLATGADAVALINVYDRPGFNEEFVSVLDVGRTKAMIVCWEDLEHPVPHVFYDNRYAGYQAADHLICSGYCPLLFVMPFRAPWAEERLSGALRAAQSTGEARIPLHVLRGESDTFADVDVPEIGYRLGASIFAQPWVGEVSGKKPGIIAANDGVAAMILSAADAAGKKAGVDFGLIGFNDDVTYRALGITTLRPPLEELGREAARNLIRMLQGETIPVQGRLQSQLLPRATTVRPKR